MTKSTAASSRSTPNAAIHGEKELESEARRRREGIRDSTSPAGGAFSPLAGDVESLNALV